MGNTKNIEDGLTKTASSNEDGVYETLRAGVAIPAHPLALNAERKLDERRQRALSRYYAAAGAGGLAVGVHTTQFAIHRPEVGLLEPVLTLAAEEMDRADTDRDCPMIRIAGICGDTAQAVREAELARGLGYPLGLLGFRDLADQDAKQWLDYARAVGEVIDLVGFYLQPSIGGPMLPFSFWQQFCEIPAVRAIKIAPFNRYQTIDVMRAVAQSGRTDIALYTGNDDNIVLDLITPYEFDVQGAKVGRRIAGGLLGHWAVWTSKAVELLKQCQRIANGDSRAIPSEMLRLNLAVTDCNAVLFDAANGFRGCVPGIHEVLRRQGLLEGTWCLDENETLSPGQASELDRVESAYPDLIDNDFVAENLSEWLSG